MSFKDLFAKVVKPLITKDTDPDTIENVVTELYDLTHHNGDNEKPKAAKTHRNNNAQTRKRRSDRKKSTVSTLEVSDWLCIHECAKVIGRSANDIKQLLDSKHIDGIEWATNFPCVHRRQVSYWFEHQSRLDISDLMDVEQTWATMTAVSNYLEVSIGAVHGAVERGEIASHRAGSKARLVNIAECEKYFGK